MKKTLTAFLAILTVFILGLSWAYAQEAKEKEKPAAAAAGEKEAKAPAVKAQTLSGTLSSVSADQKLLVVMGTGGVTYNFKVGGATRVKVGGQKAKVADLGAQSGKSVTIKFLPLRTGNSAQSIEVQ